MATLHVDQDRCKGCGFCILQCPKGALSFSGRLNKAGYDAVQNDDEKCIKCGICYTVCPDLVFTLTDD